MPRDDQLLSNLDRLITIIGHVEDSGLKFDPELEPLHLLFKWNVSREPNTIGRHKQIADENGSVWWGRFGTTASPGMGAGHLADLRHQLEDEVPTYAFLYRRGEIWRTTLLEISNDASDVDSERLPTYYRADECNLFAGSLISFRYRATGRTATLCQPQMEIRRNLREACRPDDSTVCLRAV